MWEKTWLRNEPLVHIQKYGELGCMVIISLWAEADDLSMLSLLAYPSQVEVDQEDHPLQSTAVETGTYRASDSSGGWTSTAGTVPGHWWGSH